MGQHSMVTSGRFSNPTGIYDNLSGIGVKHTFDPVKRVEPDPELPVIGDGQIVMHGTRLDVDISVRISELLQKITDITDRIEYLESVSGTATTPPTATTPEFRVGNWRWVKDDADPNIVYEQIDLYEGLTVEPLWETRRTLTPYE